MGRYDAGLVVHLRCYGPLGEAEEFRIHGVVGVRECTVCVLSVSVRGSGLLGVRRRPAGWLVGWLLSTAADLIDNLSIRQSIRETAAGSGRLPDRAWGARVNRGTP